MAPEYISLFGNVDDQNHTSNNYSVNTGIMWGKENQVGLDLGYYRVSKP